ncbi:MAG: T9SS type A sorting domain-containing protein [Sphingobacteriales bacterium]|nr:MAG: T9SS type A sorting domain-containing protein [Sphingobacteriales bacterium]
MAFDHLDGSVVDMYGKAFTVPGNTLTEKAQLLMDGKLKALGIVTSEWQLVKELQGSHAQYVNFVRTIGGHKVAFSKLQFRFTQDGKLARVKLSHAAKENITSTVGVSKDDPRLAEEFFKGLDGVNISAKKTDADFYYFPVPGEDGSVLHPAWRLMWEGKNGVIPVKLDGYIDATNGALLYRTNRVRDAFNNTVKGNVYATDRLGTPSLQPLANLMVVSAGNTYYTDGAGLLSLPSFTTFSGDYSLSGKWAYTQDYNSGVTPVFTQSFTGIGNSYTYPVTGSSNSRMVNAYYHTNRIHDFMKGYFPTFVGLDFPMRVSVDVTGDYCNAYYDFDGLNFLEAGGGCNSLAEIPDVVYHEYGHAINDIFYTEVIGMTMDNASLHEAYGDVWGMSGTQNPVLAKGTFQRPGLGNIREYNWLNRFDPADYYIEPHAGGQIVAGAWWDVGVNLGSVSAMTSLFASTYFDGADGPWGMETEVYHDVLVSALMNDDNDANLANGTPHFNAITKAFARHGIYLLGQVDIMHNELPNQPTGSAIAVSASVSVADATYLTGVTLNYKLRGGAWVKVNMTNTTGSTYTGNIPAQSAVAVIDYYIAAQTINSVESGIAPLTFDPKGPAYFATIPYQFGVGIVPVDTNTFEVSATGWTVGNVPGDNATNGKWIYAKPVASTYYDPMMDPWDGQTGEDHTTGSGKCLITDNAGINDDAGTADVDQGKTTVLSPVLNLSGYNTPIVSYYRWFSSNLVSKESNDAWIVEIGDGTTWHVIDSTYRTDMTWRKNMVAVKDHFTNLNAIQFRFVASDNNDVTLDNNGQNIVEAGIDDFYIYDKGNLSVNEVAKSTISIYPNPADQFVEVKFNGPTKGILQLFDMKGAAIGVYQLNGSSSFTIDTHTLVPGTYMLAIQNGDKKQSMNIVVQH